VLGGDHRREIVDAVFADTQEFIENTGTTQRWRIGPAFGSRACGSNRGAHFGRAGKTHLSRLLAGGRVENRRRPAAATCHLLSADIVLDFRSHRTLL
jgi:hypothetical protein